MRRVLQVAAFLLSGVATAGDAAAQASINAQTFRPAIGPENVITVEGTRTPGHLRPMAALWGEYARLPLRLQRSDGTIVADTVPDMATVHFMGGIGVTRYLSFALALPMVVYQGYDDRTPTALAAPAPPAFGIGDLRLVAKASLLRNQEGGFGLAFVPQFSFPTATPQQGSYRGDEAFTFEPRVAIDYKTARGMFLAANLSFLARTSSQQLFNVEVSHQFRYGLGAFAPIARGFGAGAEIIGAASIHNLRDIYAPLEGYLSGRWNHRSGLQVDLGGGAAFVNAVGSPQFRVFAGVGYVPQAPREVKPDPDRDGDGIVDRLDRCPFDAEDQDGFEDQDGCPDRDNDGDCVADAQDRCPSTPGLRENQGCPDEDQDRDGIVDRLDRCPAQAEDADGFEDQDGCPDPDNDKDGVLDAADRCPVSAGPAENQGCPDEDKDKDTIVDRLDQCPLEPGVAPDGCPKRQFIAVQADRIELREQIRFATGKAKIRPDSFGLLDEVVEVLKRRGDLRLRILGHTDNKGKREKNLKLSADRAAAVRDYLIGKGIDGGRLSSEGLGPDQPLQDNKTSQGREANRRTEFFIVK